MSNRFHGSLVQVNDTGVLIGGASGVGKSETTLELIERGHSFISDDQVCLSLDNGRLKGEAPEAIRGLIEIRGLGILSIPDLYGERCCLAGSVIDLAIHIEPGDAPIIINIKSRTIDEDCKEFNEILLNPAVRLDTL